MLCVSGTTRGSARGGGRGGGGGGNGGVAQDRFRDTVITKCMHTFCHVCVDERVKSRNRKCPGCGQIFAAGDVRTIYLA